MEKNNKKRDNRYIFQKKGFILTLKILDGKMRLKEFYSQLNAISYYNIFLRVKVSMLDLGLIEIFKDLDEKGHNKRYIRLTEKGKRIKKVVSELITKTSC